MHDRPKDFHRDETEDIFQETPVKVTVRLRKENITKKVNFTLVMRIAHNPVIDHFRRSACSNFNCNETLLDIFDATRYERRAGNYQR
jgi:DNA-directed RNA polymerase specialized sigma24 family protein